MSNSTQVEDNVYFDKTVGFIYLFCWSRFPRRLKEKTMKIPCLYAFILCLFFVPLTGCGLETGPGVVTQNGSAAKEKVIKLNEQHQERLEDLILPGQK